MQNINFTSFFLFSNLATIFLITLLILIDKILYKILSFELKQDIYISKIVVKKLIYLY